jgi:NhaA family Na+:H+ antiporter
VHATVAGVVVGLLTRVRRDAGEQESPAERLEHRLRPLSAGLCVPAFALFAAGVTVSADALGGALRDPAALGVVAGLVAGKAIGVFGGTFLVARWTRAELDPELAWSDVLGVAVLSGIGFTVALLIAELAFGADPTRLGHVKTAVLSASLLAGLLATVLLRLRHRHYAALPADEGVTGEGPGYARVQ